MKANIAIFGLTLVALASISLVLTENAHLANGEMNSKKTTTTCDGSECHTVVCINGGCQASTSNGSSAENKIVQNSTVP